MGTDPDITILENTAKELEQSIIAKLETKRKNNKAIMDSSGGQAVSGEVDMPKPPKTMKAGKAPKLGFDDFDGVRDNSPDGGASNFSFREQANMEYHTKRDPMQEFFVLTCQSVKLNSPHMNAVCTLDALKLY